MNDVKAKQQIVDKIKSSTNILVTVSNSPSVDGLSAALGLTMVLNDLGKHATAVFSGAIPEAMSFLEPNKTFENTTDSLRDFIIALNKEKADHLRYKVEGDSVKIFITPYRTTISSDDLEFSQGDYNVELVLALGVDNPDHLDSALESHGRILHDATVATISAGNATSQLGSIDWQDKEASSLSEMLVSLTDGLKTDKPILDAQIATAFMTGIVAATDRFSNALTTSRVMTMAAQLMTAGADQQLIAAKLQEGNEIATPMAAPSGPTPDEIEKEADAQPGDGGFAIVHDKNATLEDIANEVKEHNQEEATEAANQALDEHKQINAPVETEPGVPDVVSEPTSEEPEPTPSPELAAPPIAAYAPDPIEQAPIVDANSVSEPSTSVESPVESTTPSDASDSEAPTGPVVLADAYKLDPVEEESSHSYLGATPTITPINGATVPEIPPDVMASGAIPSANVNSLSMDPAPGSVAVDDPLAEVHASYDAAAQTQAPAIAPPINLPQPPPLPDFSTLPPPPAMPAFEPTQPGTTPELLGDIFAPESPEPIAPQPTVEPTNDPGQFKIPGQQ